jgi:flagellin
MNNLDTAIDEITSARATFGAVQNRFESVISNLRVAAENQAASRSRIMDADFAQETANLSRAQVQQQAGIAIVAQANAQAQNVLALLR